jgi:hypothetical protein
LWVSEPDRLVTVVIPAHDEQARIGFLLAALSADTSETVELVVVCNGCTDSTAGVARTFPGVVVIEIPEPSKRLALAAGDAVARHPYRAYVDADVVISSAGLRALLAALRPPVQVSAPERELDIIGCSPAVRWYYDVWRQLPSVNAGVFGRGVIVMTPEAHDRIVGLPKVMSDDLAISEAFPPAERAIVPAATVTIAVPRRLRDLLRRRIRVVTGNSQLDALELRATQARTTPRDLLRIAAAGPAATAKVGVFAFVTLLAKVAARRRIRAGDFTTWLRDESTRS